MLQYLWYILHILTNIFVENKFYCSIMTFLFSFHISSGYLTRFPMCSYTLGIMLLLCMCVYWQSQRGRARRRAGSFSLRSAWFACPVKGRWCKAMAEVSTSAPVKLCLSFTTGCSTPSFQTAIHPLLLCPSLLSHSLALRYGLWH